MLIKAENFYSIYFRVIINYIAWYIIHKYGHYVSSDFHDAYTKFARQAYGVQQSSEFWRRCVRDTERAMDMGVSRLLLTNRDSGFTEESVHQVSITMVYCTTPKPEELRHLTILEFK